MAEREDRLDLGTRARIAELEEALDRALEAAAVAETEQGRLRGELTRVSEHWAAANHAQSQWDILLAENLEEIRLANERADAAERRRADIETSTSWRVLQAALSPYRRIRGIR